MRSCVTLAIAIAVAAVAACRDVPTAPTPPTARLLTTTVWPGESVYVVSAEAAAAPAESVWVTAGNDTLPFAIHDDSTLAVTLSDLLYSTDLDLTVHTPGGFVDAGAVHVYGYLHAESYRGFTGDAIAFPDAATSPTVLIFDTLGSVVLNVASGRRERYASPSPQIGCVDRHSFGFGSSYRADSGWASLCDGAYRFLPMRVDSLPDVVHASWAAGNPHLVAEIGPRMLLLASKYDVWTSPVANDGTVPQPAAFLDAINWPLAVVISPRRDRAVLTAFRHLGGISATSGASIPVFSSSGDVVYRVSAGGIYGGSAAAFSPLGDTLYLGHATGQGIYAFDATDGRLLDSLPDVDGDWAMFADPRSDLLYLAGTDPVQANGSVTLTVIRRGTLTVAAHVRPENSCRPFGESAVFVASPQDNALYLVSAGTNPYLSDVMGSVLACKFDVP